MFSPDGGNLNLHCLLRSLHGILRTNIFIKIPGIAHLLITLMTNHNDNNTPPTHKNNNISIFLQSQQIRKFYHFGLYCSHNVWRKNTRYLGFPRYTVCTAGHLLAYLAVTYRRHNGVGGGGGG